VEVLERARWDLPGLPSTEIGFGACRGCGLVLQSPAVEPAEMERWYRESAVYTGPGRGGEPHPRKVRVTARLLETVEHALGRMPESVFQVGSSDGYTLSCFRSAGSERVVGLDPSAASRALARERYGVETLAGTVEDLGEPPHAELWVLTHVLEHLYDPLACLRRARSASPPPWLAVEVPLFERSDDLPPGFLAFEHLNYFTEESLVRVLAQAGFEVVGLEKQYADDLYPVVAAMARPVDVRAPSGEPGEREAVRERLLRYLERERSGWKRVEERLDAELSGDAGRPVWLFGAGVFAAQVLAGTRLGERFEIAGVLDSSEQKRGTALGSLRVHGRDEVELEPGDRVVITSFAAEEEIWRALAPERERGVRVIRLHPS
jgi:hypothetical protein